MKKWLDSLLEFSILGSFTQWGYQLRSKSFNSADLQVSLMGKTYLVTGANSGIGLATSLALASRGAQILLLCRNSDKAERAATLIRTVLPAQTPPPKIFLADLSDLESTREAAEKIHANTTALHGIVHNAGNGLAKKEINRQNLDSMFCINVLATYVLTEKLLPLLRNSSPPQDPSRIVWVSSGGMYTSNLNVEDLQWTKRKYEWLKVYAENKRAQVVMAEWYSQKEPKPEKVIFQSMHPGWVDTELVQNKLPQFKKLLGQALRTAEQGADTLIWLLVSERGKHNSGEFWLDRQIRKKYIKPGTTVSEAQKNQLMAYCSQILASHS